MAFKYVLLVLPALVLAKIDVELSGEYKEDNSNLKVYYSGSEVGVISDTERQTFGLNDDNLKSAVRAYFGSRPSDAYLRSPTPWGDLYQSYGWNQVIRTLIPRSGKILKISSQPVMVLRQDFQNNSTKPATFNVGISQAVENTVSSSWSKGGELSVDQEINYGFDIEVVNVGGSTSFSFSSSWGRNTEKSKTVTVGASSALEILLQPGQSVTAQLQATRGTIQIEMEYEASLSGATAVNYADGYRGHHFWSLDVQGVMASAELSNRKISREVIEIDFYTNSRVVVQDKTHGTKLVDVSF